MLLEQEVAIDALVVIEAGPMNTVRASEGIRLALGLLTYIDDAGILFVRDGVWTVGGLNPGADTATAKSLEQLKTFIEMGQKVFAVKESFDERGAKPALDGVSVIAEDEAEAILRSAKQVITVFE